MGGEGNCGYLKVPALAIVAIIGVLAFQHSNALARVLDASGHALNEARQGLDDWTARPNAAYATTQELAVFADVATAHRRATEFVDCIQLDTAKRDAEFRLTWTTKNMSLRDVERHEHFLAELKGTIGRLEAKHACSSVTIESATANVYPTLLAAAILGDTSAAACYASAIAPLPKDEESQDDIQAFRTTANEFVDAGIARGDWKFVEIMTHATGSLGHRFDWFGHLVRPSREQGYRYRKLLRLAATDSLAADLDGELASLAKQLSPETVQAMDEQAQRDYDAHFVNSPMLNERPTPCEMNEPGI
jgi:hypothetical protein